MNWWVLGATFIAVNLDFFFILLVMVNRYRLVDVMLGYLAGVLLLVCLSYFAGQVLAAFLPEWILGILGVLPIWMALHDDDDDDDEGKATHSPALAVFITYLSVCAGCNLAIFLPVLTKATLSGFGQALLFLGICTILVVGLIKLIGEIPAVKRFMTRFSEPLMKLVYVGVGLYVFWDSGLVSHLVNLI